MAGEFELVSLDRFGPALARLAKTMPQMVVDSLQRSAREGRAIVVKTARDTTPYAPIDTGAYLRAWVSIQYMDGADLVNDTLQAPVIEWGSRPHMPPAAPIEAWVRRKSRGPFNKKYADPPSSFTHRVRAAREGLRWAASRMETMRKKVERDINSRTRGPKSRLRLGQRYQAHQQEEHFFRRLAQQSASTEEAEVMAAAWMVRYSIATKGIEPRHVLGRSWPWLIRLVEHNLDEALKRAAGIRAG